MMSPVRIACVFLLFSLLPVAMSYWKKEKDYSDSWAVHVRGGSEVATSLASKHGFVNKGQVGNLKDVYHFELIGGRKEHLPEKTRALEQEDSVVFVEQQHYKQMAKKLPR